MSDFQKGDLVRYRAMAGDVFRGTIVGVHPDGRLDVELYGTGKPVEFHRLPVERFELVERSQP